MKPTKLGKNQVLRPSGIVASKDGKYFYWWCTVSGIATFASAERFKTVVERYGSEEKLVKEFVSRPAQKYLDADFTAEQIRGMVIKGKLGPLGGKPKKIEKVKKVKKATLKTFAVAKIEVAVTTGTGSIEIQNVPVYPWSGNPDYFKSTGTPPLSVEEATKDSCALPNRYLDDECRNCPLYDRCTFKGKFTAEDWKKPRSKAGPIVKVISSWEQ